MKIQNTKNSVQNPNKSKQTQLAKCQQGEFNIEDYKQKVNLLNYLSSINCEGIKNNKYYDQVSKNFMTRVDLDSLSKQSLSSANLTHTTKMAVQKGQLQINDKSLHQCIDDLQNKYVKSVNMVNKLLLDKTSILEGDSQDDENNELKKSGQSQLAKQSLSLQTGLLLKDTFQILGLSVKFGEQRNLDEQQQQRSERKRKKNEKQISHENTEENPEKKKSIDQNVDSASLKQQIKEIFKSRQYKLLHRKNGLNHLQLNKKIKQFDPLSELQNQYMKRVQSASHLREIQERHENILRLKKQQALFSIHNKYAKLNQLDLLPLIIRMDVNDNLQSNPQTAKESNFQNITSPTYFKSLRPQTACSAHKNMYRVHKFFGQRNLQIQEDQLTRNQKKLIGEINYTVQ